MRATPLPPAAACQRHGADLRNGAFVFPIGGKSIGVIASDGTDWKACGYDPPAWEHVSVSLVDRCPTWEEMDRIKEIFWRTDETVIQFHVPAREHVNYHPYCLHLWKPVGIVLPMPPSITVGPMARHNNKGKA